MDNIDMHVHTTASEGTMRPEHVVSLAAMQGLKAIAITDHDTMDGIEEAGKAGELMGVTIIPGIELSTDYQGKEVHVLGYFLDENAPALKEYQSWAAEKRQERNEKILERLRKKGFEITMEQLKEANPDAVIGRPHIARKLIGFTDAARLIKRCNGVAVLAHPLQYGYNKSQLDTLVKTAAQAGFSGMEIYYTGYTEADQKKLFDLAEKYTLLPTGGSDFHGDNKPGVQLGTGDGKLSVPAYFLIMLAQSQYQ